MLAFVPLWVYEKSVENTALQIIIESLYSRSDVTLKGETLAFFLPIFL